MNFQKSSEYLFFVLMSPLLDQTLLLVSPARELAPSRRRILNWLISSDMRFEWNYRVIQTLGGELSKRRQVK
jgi:hypothetical protein